MTLLTDTPQYKSIESRVINSLARLDVIMLRLLDCHEWNNRLSAELLGRIRRFKGGESK